MPYYNTYQLDASTLLVDDSVMMKLDNSNTKKTKHRIPQHKSSKCRLRKFAVLIKSTSRLEKDHGGETLVLDPCVAEKEGGNKGEKAVHAGTHTDAVVIVTSSSCHHQVVAVIMIVTLLCTYVCHACRGSGSPRRCCPAAGPSCPRLASGARQRTPEGLADSPANVYHIKHTATQIKTTGGNTRVGVSRQVESSRSSELLPCTDHDHICTAAKCSMLALKLCQSNCHSSATLPLPLPMRHAALDT